MKLSKFTVITVIYDELLQINGVISLFLSFLLL